MITKMSDNDIVKLVVPSYGLRGEFARIELDRQEFKDLQQAYLTEQMDLIKLVDERAVANGIGADEFRRLIDKLISPFQYWLENKIACRKINERTRKEKPMSPERKADIEEAKAQADEFSDRVGTKPEDLLGGSGSDTDPLEQTGESNLPGSGAGPFQKSP